MRKCFRFLRENMTEYGIHNAAMAMLNEIHRAIGIPLVYQLKLERLSVDKIAEKHMKALWDSAIDASIEQVSFNGGTVQLEAHIRQQKVMK